MLPFAADDMLRAPHARWLFWLLAAVCALSFAVLAPHLLYRDLNLDYPFVDGDSHDWIANGLALAGHDVRWSGRAPLLPAAIALLDRLGRLPWLPVLGLLGFLLTVLAFYVLAASLHPPPAAFVAALLLLAALQGLALEVMADVPAACLILWSAGCFIAARDQASVRPSRYAWSGLFAGLASLTQEIALGVPVAAIVTLWARRRRDLRSAWPWIGWGMVAVGQGLWWLEQRHLLAVRGGAPIDHGRLVGFHLTLTSMSYYLWSCVSLLGLPACLLLVAGIALAARQVWRRRDRDGDGDAAAALLALLLFAGFAGFFVFLYRYDGKRFLVYAMGPAALLVAGALAPLARLGGVAGRVCFAAVAAVALGAAALPLPEAPHDGGWAPLWPLPPVLASRGPGVPSSLHRPAGRDLASWSVYERVRRAARQARGAEPLPPPGLFAAADSALYLYEQAGDGGGRYRTITRLSNALGKPVRFVPRAALAAYWRYLTVSPLTSLTADYRVYRVALPGLAGSWLLVTPGDRPLEAWNHAASVPPTAGAIAEARAVAAYVGRDYAFVALFPPPPAEGDLVPLYLYFLLRTTELYVIEPRDAAATDRLLAGAAVIAERRIGGVRVTSTRALDLPTAVLRFVP